MRHHTNSNSTASCLLISRSFYSIRAKLMSTSAFLLGLIFVCGASTIQISVDASGCAEFGYAELTNAIHEAGFPITERMGDFRIIGGMKGSWAERLLNAADVELSTEPEALTIRKTIVDDHPVLILHGADERGLMYALLDTATRIGWSKGSSDPFKHIDDISDKPFIADRTMSTYTMQATYFRQRLLNEDYWEKYFALMANSRINRFVIIFGYENGGFMGPAFPFFFDVEGFPEVKMVGISADQQKQHTEAFRRVIEIAHEHGVQITPGFWDFIKHRKIEVPIRSPYLVSGVNTENLVAYNQAALTKFIDVFPKIDSIQFRMHWESGITREETPMFWRNMFSIIQKKFPDMPIDLRAKDLPDSVIADAIEQGLNFRIATKYWMEQLGLPFHPTHIVHKNQRDRRHGYADLLRYPKQYDMQWRVWNGGTTRCLLWGSPEYVSRIAKSTKIYAGSSMEFNEMLATKMLSKDHTAEPFELLNKPYRFYDYEFERYWYTCQAWGRMMYNPNTPNQLWEKTFVHRFGDPGEQLRVGLEKASWVLPRIVASAYNYHHFPTTRGWIGMMRQGDLSFFAGSENSDIQQFQTFRHAAEDALANKQTVMRTPADSARWFRAQSEEILKQVALAKKKQSHLDDPEFVTIITDLNILAHMAKYYAERIPAAVYYNMYLVSSNPVALKQAIAYEEKAMEAWRLVVCSAGDVYSDQLVFGRANQGYPLHWKNELPLLEEGLSELKLHYNKVGTQPSESGKSIPDYMELYPPDSSPPCVELERIKTAKPNQPITISATVTDPDGIDFVNLRFRHLTQFEDYQLIQMKQSEDRGKWTATIPGDFVLPEWDLMYFIEVMDQVGHGRMYPDLDHEMPYVVIHLERE